MKEFKQIKEIGDEQIKKLLWISDFLVLNRFSG